MGYLKSKYLLTHKTYIDEVIKQFGNHLKGFIRNKVKSSEDAEDIFQDVFYQLIQTNQLMKPIDQISAWLYTVARNKIIDFRRKKKPEPVSEFFSDNDDDEVLKEINGLLTTADNSPEIEYFRSLIWSELEKALELLPDEQRLVFEMNELKGLSFKEIAKLTGESENTLISRKRYAVLHLRVRLKYLYNELINF